MDKLEKSNIWIEFNKFKENANRCCDAVYLGKDYVWGQNVTENSNKFPQQEKELK